MEITRETVDTQRERVLERAPHYVEMINETRARLGPEFDVAVENVDVEVFNDEVRAVFGDGDLSVNVATLMVLLRDLDVTDDYPGFIVDELLGRRLAATIAGGQPLATLAEATFHFIDIRHDGWGGGAGEDDLEAGVAAGFQTRLPGWPWQSTPGPFDR